MVADRGPRAWSCLHASLEIDRVICPCGFRHVYCNKCETRMDKDSCPWLPADAEFVAWMRHIWGGGLTDEAED